MFWGSEFCQLLGPGYLILDDTSTVSWARLHFECNGCGTDVIIILFGGKIKARKRLTKT